MAWISSFICSYHNNEAQAENQTLWHLSFFSEPILWNPLSSSFKIWILYGSNKYDGKISNWCSLRKFGQKLRLYWLFQRWVGKWAIFMRSEGHTWWWVESSIHLLIFRNNRFRRFWILTFNKFPPQHHGEGDFHLKWFIKTVWSRCLKRWWRRRMLSTKVLTG